MKTEQIIHDILEAKKDCGGITSVYFAACGGSIAAMYPAKYLLESESKTLKIGYYTSNEFVHATPKACGPNSLVICCTKNGTPETIEACKKARQAGAATIAIVGSDENPMVKEADHYLVYGGTAQMSKNNLALVLMLAFELLHQIEDYEYYEDAVAAYEKIESINARGRAYFAPRAKAFAEAYKDAPLIYVLGGGPTDGMAYSFEICSLIETQWMHAVKINTGEYFHGPFEVTDCNAGFVVQIAEGSDRELDERCLRFLKKYAKRFEVLDAKELGLSTIDPSVVDYFNHSLFNNVYPIYNAALAEARQHPLSTRRYMWKVAY